MDVLASILAVALAAAPAISPSPQASSAPSTADATWIAEHLPSTYNEDLAGTTNTIAARYRPSGCTIAVALDFSWQFNGLRDNNRAKAFTVKGSVLHGHHFDASDEGGTIDFSIVDPSSLHIADAIEYLGTEQVNEGGFDFTFQNESDAKAMLDAMTPFAQGCAAARKA